MEAFQNVYSRHQKIPKSSLLNFTPLTARQKNHLGDVYANLAISVLLTAVGVQFTYHVLALPTFLSFIAQMACAFYVAFTSPGMRAPVKNSPQELKRLGAFCLLAFFSGVTITPFLHYARMLNPSILPTAFCATTLVFVCFSLGAIFADQRKYFFLGGILSSVLGYLSLVSLCNIFFHSKLAHDVVLYGGLISYLGFVLYDTQVILYECEQGYRDSLMHALTFYADVLGIFIRLVQILMEREAKKHDNGKRRE